MRVITGKARGRKLISPDGDNVRPTTDTVKESVFSIIQFAVEGSVFLDAFAGSGQMGIEALSRGAEKVVFVDNNRRSLKVTKDNIRLCGLEENAEVVSGDSISFMTSTKERFDIVFLDPPYKTGLLQKALEKAVGIVKEDGIIIGEYPKDDTVPEEIGDFCIRKTYKYGMINVSIYAHKDVVG